MKTIGVVLIITSVAIMHTGWRLIRQCHRDGVTLFGGLIMALAGIIIGVSGVVAIVVGL